jgi:PiT family inorganic phosphate transporter
MLNYLGLPAPPLVPVSITQAMVGGVMGIGLAKGGRYLNFRILGKTGLGWVITPVAAGVICLILLFIVKNVFDREVYKEVKFEINKAVIENINSNGISVENFSGVRDSTFESHQSFRLFLSSLGYVKEEQLYSIFKSAKLEYFRVDSNFAKSNMNPYVFSAEQINSVMSLHNEGFRHRWQLVDRLKSKSPEWNALPDKYENLYRNKKLNDRIIEVCDMFLIK